MNELEKLKKANELHDESWKDSKNMERLTFEAAAMLEDVLKINPNNVVALTNLGAIYADLTRYKEALDLLNKAKKLNFCDQNLYRNLGIVSIGLKRDREAKKYFEIASTMEEHELTFEAYIDFHAL